MPKVFSVTQINTYIRDMLRRDVVVRALSVKGEVGGCTYHGSGHIYFTLKDAGARLSCVMFASNRAGLKFQLREGQQVQVRGRIDVYPQGGSYQLYAEEIVLDGAGALYEEYLRLKERLAEEGLFAKEYKRPLPQMIRVLGVITAPTGAAIRDIINIATRRNPYLQIILYPAIVQGEAAAPSIVAGFDAFTRLAVRHPDKAPDVIIAGRGGGSIEDLWAFNEEAVARAIFNCPVPVISAVGHETDVTIADFVADLRAPTPSAAAELAVYETDRLEEEIDGLRSALIDGMTGRIEDAKYVLEQLQKNLRYLSPDARVRDLKLQTDAIRERLCRGMEDVVAARKHRLALYAERLNGVSPLNRLKAGYGYLTDGKGQRITQAGSVREGDETKIYLTDGILKTRVERVEELPATMRTGE